MSTRNRLGGHAILSEGAAWQYFHDGDDHLTPVWHNGTGGVGMGVCRCGAVSPVLTSGTARRQWHREHKDSIRRVVSGVES